MFREIEVLEGPEKQDTEHSGRPLSIGKRVVKERQDQDDEVLIGGGSTVLLPKDFTDLPFTEDEIHKIDNSVTSIDELVQRNGRYALGANLVAAVSEQQPGDSKMSSFKKGENQVGDSRIFSPEQKRNSLEMELDNSRITDKVGHIQNSL